MSIGSLLGKGFGFAGGLLGNRTFIIAGVAAALAFGGGYGLAWKIQGGNISAIRLAQTEALNKAETAARLEQARIDGVAFAGGLKVANEQVRIQTNTNNLIREIPRYVSETANRQCIVNNGFVRLHDAAIRGRDLSETEDLPDHDAGSGISLSTVATVDTINFGKCLQWRSIAAGFQDVAREMNWAPPELPAP